MDRHDPRVAQLRQSSSLLKEGFALRMRQERSGAEDLDGYRPVELRVVAKVYRAETARAQNAADSVATESRGSAPGSGNRVIPI
jgi:hypothetical protein